MRSKYTIAIFIVWIGWAITARAAEDPTDTKPWEIGVTLSSRYISRGAEMLEREPAVQPFINYTYGNSGFTASAWSSFALSKRDQEEIKECDEVDFTLAYARTIGIVDITIAADHLNFIQVEGYPDSHSTDYDLAGTISFPSLPLSPSLLFINSFNRDGDDGQYLEGAISDEINLIPALPITSTLSAGYTNQSWLIDEDDTRSPGISHITLSFQHEFTVGSFAIEPVFNLTSTQNRQINPDKLAIWGGITLKHSW